MAGLFEQFKAREVEGEELVLSTGVTVRVRPCSLEGLIKRGIVPRDLLSGVAASLADVAQAGEDKEFDSLQFMLDNFDVNLAYLENCMVEPLVRLESDYEKGIISITAFRDEEVRDIINFTAQGVLGWNTFHPEQGGSVQPVENGNQSKRKAK